MEEIKAGQIWKVDMREYQPDWIIYRKVISVGEEMVIFYSSNSMDQLLNTFNMKKTEHDRKLFSE